MGRLRAAPDISLRRSFFKGQGHRGQRSNFCISAVLGPICMKLGECIQVDPWLKFIGPIGSKVIEYRGQRSNLCFFFCCSPTSLRSLGRSSPNLVGRLRAALDISSRGSMSSRSKVKFLYLGSPWSDLHETWWVYTGWSLIKIYGSNWVKGHRGQRSNLCCFFLLVMFFVLFVFIAAIILLLRRDG